MHLESPTPSLRSLLHVEISADLIVVGGGLAGTCAAIQAARAGVNVVLVQDRPVLGGNSSSEVRLWGLGATSHMANNNRWAREGGLVDELLVENTFRNPEGNPLIWDTILLEKVHLEANITLLLNTAVHGLEKSTPTRLKSVSAFCPQNQTRYTLRAPLFCDASGDGVVGFQAGAAFRMGAEEAMEFDEGFAPDASYGELLGHTIYFYSKDTGKPVTFVPPAFALKDITNIPRFKSIRADQNGCDFWWIEYGGRRDTIAETEEIKWELWSIVYGVWNHIKNSGEFQGVENLTLEWVGTIPGKRESRRFEGDAILTQNDVVRQVRHADIVALGGWSLDLHPADAVYSDKSPCNQYHSKGVYGIPFRCYYSRNIENLFLAGRIISASHVAFGSSRVMLTCAHGACAVGLAAAHCTREGLTPRDLTDPVRMHRLQTELNATGQAIPEIPSDLTATPIASARITASSTLALAEIPSAEGWRNLSTPLAQLVPWEPDYRPGISFQVRSRTATTLRVALRCAGQARNFTPEITVEEHRVDISPGEQTVRVRFTASVPDARYAFITLYGSEDIEVPLSDFRCTGLVSVQQKFDAKVAKSGEQNPPEGIGIDRFEFWIPTRRPGGHNLPLRFEPPLANFASADHLRNGFERPTLRSNAWIADPADPAPALTLAWDEPQTFTGLTLCLDTDFDHAMETAQWGHPERVMPFCVRDCVVEDGEGRILAELSNNHQTRPRLDFYGPVTTRRLILRPRHPGPHSPAAIFAVLLHSPPDAQETP